MTNNFSGYVLAGGKSSRMGADKAFLKIGEKTFLENATRALKPNCGRVKIVLNKSQTHIIEKLPENAVHIFDIYENRGALGGVHAALKDCKTEFAIILAVDLPFVDEGAIKKLCEIVMGSKDFSAIVPRQNDRRLQPLCAVYQVKNCLPKLEEILSKNESSSVHDFLEMVETMIVDQTRLSDNENLFLNVNNSKDYKVWDVLQQHY
jgi:molybdenum cofactor guanylyltransferase